MKRMLVLFFMLIGFIALGSVMVESDDYRINDPPGIEYLGDIVDRSQNFPVIVDQTVIQVFGFIRLPAIDDWPALGELLDNNSYALFNNYNKEYTSCAQSITMVSPNMTTIRWGKIAAEEKSVKWIKSYSMAH